MPLPDAIAADESAITEQHEKALLASMLAGPEGLEDAIGITTEEDFAHFHHRLVFRAIRDLWHAGESVNASAVFERLIPSKAEFRQANPGEFLGSINDLDPTGAYARANAHRVRCHAVRRRLLGEIAIIERDLADGRPIDELLAAGETAILGLGDQLLTGSAGPRPAREFVIDAMQRIDERQANGGKIVGLATGFADLDAVLNGLRPGELTIVAARPSVGKSALGLGIADHVAAAGTGVLFVSLEMPEAQLADRLLSMRSGVPMWKFTRGERLGPRDVERLSEASGEAHRLPLHVDDAGDRTATQIAAIARRYVRRHRVGLIVVDYLQLLMPENPKDNRTQQVGLSTRVLMRIARQCKVPVIALAQLNRDVESRNGGKPRLSDLRESGEIEQHAHAVLLLHRTEQNEDAECWNVDAVIAKNRNGPTGDVTLQYRRPVMRFENLSPSMA